MRPTRLSSPPRLRRHPARGGPSRRRRATPAACLLAVCTAGWVQAATVTPLPQTLGAPAARDQDDVAIWIHPADRAQSTIIAADKQADALWVYDLQGRVLQALERLGDPGNVDVRYDFPLGAHRVDLVVFNDREPAPHRLRALRVDPVSRALAPIDDGSLVTGPNYGSCLYRSPTSGKFYAFTTAKDPGTSEQWELTGEAGTVRATRVRTFTVGSESEGCVADDEQRRLYVAEEGKGVWVYGAEPSDGAARRPLDDGGHLDPDVEGIALYRGAAGSGYVIVSSQGASEFDVYDRMPDPSGRHRFRGTFTLRGVESTDGLEVTGVDLGGAFARGLLVAHNGARPAALSLVGWTDVAEALRLGPPESGWDPRARAAGAPALPGPPPAAR